MARERREALLKLLESYFGTLFETDLNPCGLHLVLRPRSVAVPILENGLRDRGIACGTLSELTRGPCTNDALLLGFAAFSPDVIESMRPALDSALAPFV